MPHALYNEIDPYAAAWLRNLIDAGVIAPGVVDERDIRDIDPFELREFTQCHFFAGIGVWSYALRSAGWSDDRPVWTGSCPCQPFSAAGRGVGFADERHLWPAFHHLIEVCKPPVVFGEQVASKDGLAWLDVVHADMEAAGYAFGALDLCAAGVGAPHIRQRLFFVAHSGCATSERNARTVSSQKAREHRARLDDGRLFDRPEHGRTTGDLAHSNGGSERMVSHRDSRMDSRGAGNARAGFGGGCENGGMADTNGVNAGAEWEQRGGEQRLQPADGGTVRVANAESVGLQRRQDDGDSWRRERALGQGRSVGELEHSECFGRLDAVEAGSAFETGGARRPVPTNSFWRNADWLGCTDGKWRPVESSTFPLAPGIAFRLGSDSPFAGKSRAKMLRGYGNAIVAPLAEELIKTAMEYLP